MSYHHYWTNREQEAHEQGHRDAHFGRMDYDYDRYADNEVDRAYFMGREEERRQEELRREERAKEEDEERRAHERYLAERRAEEEQLYQEQQHESDPGEPEQRPPAIRAIVPDIEAEIAKGGKK